MILWKSLQKKKTKGRSWDVPFVKCLLKVLWQSAAEEDGSSCGAASLVDQEDYVLAALYLRGDALEVVFVVDGLTVDFKDDQAFCQIDVIGERVGLYVLHHHPVPCGDA